MGALARGHKEVLAVLQANTKVLAVLQANGGVKDDEKEILVPLSSSLITRLIPPDVDHPGAGSVFSDGAFSEKFLEQLESLVLSLICCSCGFVACLM